MVHARAARALEGASTSKRANEKTTNEASAIARARCSARETCVYVHTNTYTAKENRRVHRAVKRERERGERRKRERSMGRAG